jgi:hypothetical protein
MLLCQVREGLLYERVRLVMQRSLLSWHGWLFHRRLIHRLRENNRSLCRHTADHCSLCDRDSFESQVDKVERDLILRFAREQADSLYRTVASSLESQDVRGGLTKFFEYDGR